MLVPASIDIAIIQATRTIQVTRNCPRPRGSQLAVKPLLVKKANSLFQTTEMSDSDTNDDDQSYKEATGLGRAQEERGARQNKILRNDSESSSDNDPDADDDSSFSDSSSTSSTESAYYEPWDMIPNVVHMAVYARDVVAPLSLAERKVKGRDWIDSAFESVQNTTKPDAANDAEEDENNADDDTLPVQQRFHDWDQQFVTVSTTSVSIGGLKHLHDTSASSSYGLVLSEVPSHKTLHYLWIRVSLPDFREGVSLLQVKINNKWHSEQWRLKNSICEQREWHWQRYPHALSSKLFVEKSAHLRILHNTMGVRVSALWFTADASRYPPGYDPDFRPPTRILQCYPEKKTETYHASQPWTAFRVPDDPEVRKKLQRFEHVVRSGGARAITSEQFLPGGETDMNGEAGGTAKAAADLTSSRLFRIDLNDGTVKFGFSGSKRLEDNIANSANSYSSSSEDEDDEVDPEEAADLVHLVDKMEQDTLEATFERIRRGDQALANADTEAQKSADLYKTSRIAEIVDARIALHPVTAALSRDLNESKLNITSKLIHRLVDNFQTHQGKP